MNHVLLIGYYGMHQGISLENLTPQGSRNKNIQSVGRRLKCLPCNNNKFRSRIIIFLYCCPVCVRKE